MGKQDENTEIVNTFREAARLTNPNSPSDRQLRGWFTNAAEKREKGTPVDNEADLLKMAQATIKVAEG